MQSKAFENIINEFGPAVYRTALIKTGSSDSAQDVYQQVFLLLYEKKPSFKYREQLKVWLLSAATKLAAAERRRFDNSRTVPLENADERHITDELSFELYDLISRLPETLCDVTVLFYIEDMTVSDIAKVLGLSHSAVKSRLSRARRQLQKIYEEELL